MESDAPDNQSQLKGLEGKILGNFLDKARDGVLIARAADRRFVYANASICSMLGYEPRELCALRVDDIHPAEDLPRILKSFALGCQGETAFVKDLPLMGKDGVLSMADLSGFPMEFQGMPCLAGFFRDTIELRRAEQALLRSEEENLALISAIPDMLFMVDAEGCFLRYCSPNNDQLLMPPESFIGKTLAEVLPPDLARAALADVQQALLGAPPTLAEYPLSIQGEEYFFERRIASCGKEKALIIVRDITERYRAQEALRSAKQFNDLILDSIPDAVSIVDVNDFSIVEANRTFLDAYGLSRQEALGRPCYEVTHHRDSPCQPPEDECPLLETLRTSSPATAQHIHCGKNGEKIHVEVSTSPMLDPGGHNILKVVHAARDITKRKAAEDRLDYLACHDSLTGLFNRTMITETLRILLARARRFGGSVAVLLMDLDDFKLINDALGHQAGDELLVQVADRIKGTVRETDMIARLGGDEFIVLLTDLETSAKPKPESNISPFPIAAATLAGRILSSLETPFEVGDIETYVKASLGISLFPEDADEELGLIRYADSAMYKAKEMGKGHFRYFFAEMASQQQQRLALVTQINKAIETGEFLLYYQPIIRLESGEIVGAEALIRWRRSDGSLVPPGAFLAVAEESGLIIPLGDWVLKEACRQIRFWQDRGLEVQVAVNLSVRQFWQSDILQKVMDAVAASGISSGLLALEITESAMILDPVFTENLIDSFRREGLGVYLDDFGTGYSSLNRLKQLRLDKLKIDKSFIDGIPADGKDMAIIGAVTDLAHTMGLETVAEGIETEEQWEALKLLGCQFGQGYYFSCPLPAWDFETLLTGNRHFGPRTTHPSWPLARPIPNEAGPG